MAVEEDSYLQTRLTACKDKPIANGMKSKELPKLLLPEAVDSCKNSSPSRRSHARNHLVHSLRDRSLKGPLKWSKRVSEVSIPNYKCECRSLGDPLLFIRQRTLPTALAKREEFLMDTPLATFSYHVSKQSGTTVGKRLAEPLLGREVTLSELRRLMKPRGSTSSSMPLTDHRRPSNSLLSSSYASNSTIRSSSTELIDSTGFKISIQDKVEEESVSKQSLPQIRLTIKQEPDKSAVSRLRHQLSSPSWGPETSKKWRTIRNKDGDLDSMLELMNNAKTDQSSNQHQQSNPQYDPNALLRNISKQPKLERTKEWLYRSPLDSTPEEESPLMKQFRAQKPTRRVRFGGGHWVHRDTEFMYE